MKKKILYVEDEQNQLELIMEVLGMAGYDVYGALDGITGLKLVSEKSPDLILLDLNLPRMSGWEVITKLQGDNKLKNIPIVVITGDSDSEGLEKCITAGSSGFLKKPLNYKLLPRIISDYIDGKKEKVKVTPKKREGYLREQSLRLVDRLHVQIENLTKTNKRMEILNKELERRGAYINKMLDPLIVVDLEGNIIDYNLALEKFLVSEWRELTEYNVFDFVDLENRKIIEQEDKKRYSNLSSSNYRLTFKDFNGVKKQVLISGHPIVEKNKIAGTYAIIKDISDQQLLEEKYKNIFENTSEGLYQSTLDGKFITVNPSVVKILGYDSKEELLKKSIPDDIYQDSASRQKYIKILIEQKSVTAYEEVMITKNGDKIYTIGASRLITNENGKEPYIEGNLIDITERKLIDQEREIFTQTLEEKNRQLKEANHLKDEFLANMSHELRTPLNSIIGFSEILVDGLSGDLNDEQFEFINNVRKSGLHLLNLINDILDLSKIRAGMMKPSPEAVELINLSIETCTTLKAQAEKKEISIIFDPPDEQIFVEADPLMIKQVLLNIVGNAIKFTAEKGEVRVILSEVQVSNWDNNSFKEVKSGKGDAIRYQIIDTGVGIEEKNVDIIFDEFRQVDGSYTRNSGGTGLGLPLSIKLINLHHGKLWVESEVNVGSCFSILLHKKLSGKTDKQEEDVLSSDDKSKLAESIIIT